MKAHGTALVERVIGAVAADPGRLVLDYNRFAGPWVEGEPAPVAVTAFPSGRPVPPSLQRWLAYDGSLLRRHGWLDEAGRLTPRTLAELGPAEFGPIGSLYASPSLARFDECFLLPGGSDSRRVLVVAEPDAVGEYPVVALDVDDLPCIELMYPGFDVYLADTAGLLEGERGSGYSGLAAHRDYATRMAAHAGQLFGGELSEDFTRWQPAPDQPW